MIPQQLWTLGSKFQMLGYMKRDVFQGLCEKGRVTHTGASFPNTVSMPRNWHPKPRNLAETS